MSNDRRHQRERGQALVEFALVLPILATLILGVIQFGIVLHDYLALAGLWRPRLARSLPASACRAAAAALGGLRALHSGAVGDYVTWLVAGTAILGGLLALTVR